MVLFNYMYQNKISKWRKAIRHRQHENIKQEIRSEHQRLLTLTQLVRELLNESPVKEVMVGQINCVLHAVEVEMLGEGELGTLLSGLLERIEWWREGLTAAGDRECVGILCCLSACPGLRKCYTQQLIFLTVEGLFRPHLFQLRNEAMIAVGNLLSGPSTSLTFTCLASTNFSSILYDLIMQTTSLQHIDQQPYSYAHCLMHLLCKYTKVAAKQQQHHHEKLLKAAVELVGALVDGELHDEVWKLACMTVVCMDVEVGAVGDKLLECMRGRWHLVETAKLLEWMMENYNEVVDVLGEKDIESMFDVVVNCTYEYKVPKRNTLLMRTLYHLLAESHLSPIVRHCYHNDLPKLEEHQYLHPILSVFNEFMCSV